MPVRERSKGKDKLERPGREEQMKPQPVYARPGYVGAAKLKDKVVIITGGDSGIGRAVAIACAKEGADVAIVFLEESQDAKKTRELVEAEGRRCELIKGDIRSERFCQRIIEKTIKSLGRIDVLINNAAEQHPAEDPELITSKQLLKTFGTNVFGMFFLTNAALKHLRKQKGSCIINTASIVAYRGSKELIDYSASKGAVIAYTRSLSKSLAPDIRVNAVAPGQIWTPLIPSTFPDDKVKDFGKDTPMQRPGQPWECAGCYVFLASDDASYITGQVIHPNGGEVVNA